MANLGNEICDEVAQMCQDRHIKDIMGFQHDWNKEVIAQFYATIYFGHDSENSNERTIYWITEGHHYQCSYTSFCRYLRLDDQDVNRPKLHYDLPLSADQVRFMYPRDRVVLSPVNLWAESKLGLKQKIKKACKSAPA